MFAVCNRGPTPIVWARMVEQQVLAAKRHEECPRHRWNWSLGSCDSLTSIRSVAGGRDPGPLKLLMRFCFCFAFSKSAAQIGTARPS